MLRVGVGRRHIELHWLFWLAGKDAIFTYFVCIHMLL